MWRIIKAAHRAAYPAPPVPIKRVHGNVPQPLGLEGHVAERDRYVLDKRRRQGRAPLQGVLQLGPEPRPKTRGQDAHPLRPGQQPDLALRRPCQPALPEEVQHRAVRISQLGMARASDVAFSGIAITAPAFALRATASATRSTGERPTTESNPPSG